MEFGSSCIDLQFDFNLWEINLIGAAFNESTASENLVRPDGRNQTDQAYH